MHLRDSKSSRMAGTSPFLGLVIISSILLLTVLPQKLVISADTCHHWHWYPSYPRLQHFPIPCHTSFTCRPSWRSEPRHLERGRRHYPHAIPHGRHFRKFLIVTVIKTAPHSFHKAWGTGASRSKVGQVHPALMRTVKRQRTIPVWPLSCRTHGFCHRYQILAAIHRHPNDLEFQEVVTGHKSNPASLAAIFSSVVSANVQTTCQQFIEKYLLSFSRYSSLTSYSNRPAQTADQYLPVQNRQYFVSASLILWWPNPSFLVKPILESPLNVTDWTLIHVLFHVIERHVARRLRNSQVGFIVLTHSLKLVGIVSPTIIFQQCGFPRTVGTHTQSGTTMTFWHLWAFLRDTGISKVDIFHFQTLRRGLDTLQTTRIGKGETWAYHPTCSVQNNVWLIRVVIWQIRHCSRQWTSFRYGPIHHVVHSEWHRYKYFPKKVVSLRHTRLLLIKLLT
jgi:hypothetical protein